MTEDMTVSVDVREVTGKSIAFNKPHITSAMRLLGREIRSDARNLVARKKVSEPDEYPGRVTGRLSRSIVSFLGSGGLYVAVMPRRGNAFGGLEFYPSFLHYGVRATARKASHRKKGDSDPYRIAPRKNYMADALEAKKNRVRTVLLEAIEQALGDT